MRERRIYNGNLMGLLQFEMNPISQMHRNQDMIRNRC